MISFNAYTMESKIIYDKNLYRNDEKGNVILWKL